MTDFTNITEDTIYVASLVSEESLKSVYATFGSIITLNFNVFLEGSSNSQKDAYMLFTFSDKRENIKVPKSEAVKNADGSYTFTVTLYTFPFDTEITAQIFYGNHASDINVTTSVLEVKPADQITISDIKQMSKNIDILSQFVNAFANSNNDSITLTEAQLLAIDYVLNFDFRNIP